MTKTNDTKPMNPYHQFLRMVWKMRREQKMYFSTKSPRALRAAQSLERDVDKWMETVGFASAKIKQMAFDAQEEKKESGDVTETG